MHAAHSTPPTGCKVWVLPLAHRRDGKGVLILGYSRTRHTLTVTWLDFYYVLSFYTIQKSEWLVGRHCKNRVTWLSRHGRLDCSCIGGHRAIIAMRLLQPLEHVSLHCFSLCLLIFVRPSFHFSGNLQCSGLHHCPSRIKSTQYKILRTSAANKKKTATFCRFKQAFQQIFRSWICMNEDNDSRVLCLATQFAISSNWDVSDFRFGNIQRYRQLMKLFFLLSLQIIFLSKYVFAHAQHQLEVVV